MHPSAPIAISTTRRVTSWWSVPTAGKSGRAFLTAGRLSGNLTLTAGRSIGYPSPLEKPTSERTGEGWGWVWVWGVETGIGYLTVTMGCRPYTKRVPQTIWTSEMASCFYQGLSLELTSLGAWLNWTCYEIRELTIAALTDTYSRRCCCFDAVLLWKGGRTSVGIVRREEGVRQGVVVRHRKRRKSRRVFWTRTGS